MTLTPSHLVYRSSTNGAEAVYASSLKVDDRVYVHQTSESLLAEETVRQIYTTRHLGAVAPVTSKGTLIVDDIAASCYAIVNNHALAHASFAPFRIYKTFTNLIERFSTSSAETETLHTTAGRCSGSEAGASDPQECLTDSGDDPIHPYADFLYSLAPYVIDMSILYGH